ncbi:hypothetical protein YC2023_002175 [Brassica napus]
MVTGYIFGSICQVEGGSVHGKMQRRYIHTNIKICLNKLVQRQSMSKILFIRKRCSKIGDTTHSVLLQPDSESKSYMPMIQF